MRERILYVFVGKILNKYCRYLRNVGIIIPAVLKGLVERLPLLRPWHLATKRSIVTR